MLLSEVKQKNLISDQLHLKPPLMYSARRFQKSDELIYDLLLFQNICTYSAKRSMILVLALDFCCVLLIIAKSKHVNS